MDSYRTLAGPCEGLFKDRGSRFLAFVSPVADAEAAENEIEKRRKAFHDARHVCFAWRLGPEGAQARAYDAGEPMHSAGVPILNTLRSLEITQVVAVVVRYFGGTQLGLPGLIAAYETATREAVASGSIVEKVVLHSFTIRFPYDQTAVVNKLIHRHKAEVMHSAFAEDCVQTLGFRPSLIGAARDEFRQNGIFIEIS